MQKPPWLLEAEKDMGQKEWPWRLAEQSRIVEMFKYTTYHATKDEVPWCSAAVNKWMVQGRVQRIEVSGGSILAFIGAGTWETLLRLVAWWSLNGRLVGIM